MVTPFSSSFSGRKILITGHTGFKGSWLSLWLSTLGAELYGYSLSLPGSPCHFEMANLSSLFKGHWFGDVGNYDQLAACVNEARPDAVIHLAAQALVRPSYQNPVGTWRDNLMGTVNILEAIRNCDSVQAALLITTDKCYANREWFWGYRECDALGGRDPYSASKAAAELAIASYRDSFFQNGKALIASARAGNVIGGGDWAEDRLIPDAARAVAQGRALVVRNPSSTRPWQHVLDALHGYLLVLSGLLEGRESCAEAFNFGPESNGNMPVSEVLHHMQQYWPELSWQVENSAAIQPHEANLLYLDSAKARSVLRWRPKWDIDEALKMTALWYRQALPAPGSALELSKKQLEIFNG